MRPSKGRVVHYTPIDAKESLVGFILKAEQRTGFDKNRASDESQWVVQIRAMTGLSDVLAEDPPFSSKIDLPGHWNWPPAVAL